MPASYMEVLVQVLIALLLIHHLANVQGWAGRMEDKPRTCSPASSMEKLGFWCWPGQPLGVVAIWRVDQGIEDLILPLCLPSLSLSFFFFK